MQKKNLKIKKRAKAKQEKIIKKELKRSKKIIKTHVDRKKEKVKAFVSKFTPEEIELMQTSAELYKHYLEQNIAKNLKETFPNHTDEQRADLIISGKLKIKNEIDANPNAEYTTTYFEMNGTRLCTFKTQTSYIDELLENRKKYKNKEETEWH